MVILRWHRLSHDHTNVEEIRNVDINHFEKFDTLSEKFDCYKIQTFKFSNTASLYLEYELVLLAPIKFQPPSAFQPRQLNVKPYNFPVK